MLMIPLNGLVVAQPNIAKYIQWALNKNFMKTINFLAVTISIVIAVFLYNNFGSVVQNKKIEQEPIHKLENSQVYNKQVLVSETSETMPGYFNKNLVLPPPELTAVEPEYGDANELNENLTPLSPELATVAPEYGDANELNGNLTPLPPELATVAPEYGDANELNGNLTPLPPELATVAPEYGDANELNGNLTPLPPELATVAPEYGDANELNGNLTPLPPELTAVVSGSQAGY
ncbi:hypothetical protein [Thiothrix subterranea]|uniref:Uncharacterized protein n=1 Tax=Thiothrix subterranea TaxID=2735563 RepID=A0AA51R339_9GAMM|nr:hypothetical protein [Thiothrix subterranea]WML88569.1 hypothetical protein RCG00_09370 [Thiothrix subterranea]